MTTTATRTVCEHNPHNTFGKGHAARAVNGGSDAYFTAEHVAADCMEQLKAHLRRARIPLTKWLYV